MIHITWFKYHTGWYKRFNAVSSEKTFLMKKYLSLFLIFIFCSVAIIKDLSYAQENNECVFDADCPDGYSCSNSGICVIEKNVVRRAQVQTTSTPITTSSTSSTGGTSSTSSSSCTCTKQFNFSDGTYCITAPLGQTRCIANIVPTYQHRISTCQSNPAGGCDFVPTNTSCCAIDYKMEFAPGSDGIQYCVAKRLFTGLISDDMNYTQAQLNQIVGPYNQVTMSYDQICAWTLSTTSCTPQSNTCSASNTVITTSSSTPTPTPTPSCGYGGAYGNYCDISRTCPPNPQGTPLKCQETYHGGHGSNAVYKCGCIELNKCGNGLTENNANETCDHGTQNGLDGECTKNCKFVCGHRTQSYVCAEDECPNANEKCAFDSSANTCKCVVPPDCNSNITTNPQCTGGNCPNGEICRTIITANVNPSTNVGRCECRKPCGNINPANLSCNNGACTTTNTTCQSNVSTGQCECLPLATPPPQCEGNLPTNTIIQNLNKCNIGNGNIPYNLFGGNNQTCFKCSQFAEIFCKCIKCHWGNVGEVFQLFSECSYKQDCSKRFGTHLINLVKETQGSIDHYYIIEPQLVGLSGIDPLTGQAWNPIYCDWTQATGSAINVPDNCKNARCKAEVNFLSSLQIAPPQTYNGDVYECRDFKPAQVDGGLLSLCTNFNVQVGLSDVPAACCPGLCSTIPNVTNIPAAALSIDEPTGGYNPNLVCPAAIPPTPPPQTPCSCQFRNPDGSITNVPANSSICLTDGTLHTTASCTQNYNLFGSWGCNWLYTSCPNYCIQSTAPATGLQKAYCN